MGVELSELGNTLIERTNTLIGVDASMLCTNVIRELCQSSSLMFLGSGIGSNGM